LKRSSITPLPQRERHYLLAAEGWLELGNHLEAHAELDEITPTLRGHPDVLALRFQIYALARHWDDAVEIAGALVRLVPHSPIGWIHRSYALHILKATQDARDLLLPAVDKFPNDAEIRYNLACYECQLGNLPEAKRWLAESFALDDAKEAKLEALNDPDLEPLWQHIGKL